MIPEFTTQILIRCSPDLKKKVYLAAQMKGVSLSKYLRELLLEVVMEKEPEK